MADRISFSNRQQSLEDVAIHHSDVQAALFEFFAGNSHALLARYSDTTISDARDRSLAELDLTSSLSVLSCTEAALRLDYLARVYGRWRDPLSKELKVIHRKKGSFARLEDDLLRLWRDETNVSRSLLGDLIGAFKFRHWLAHGRYWTQKFGRKYDYVTVYQIAYEFLEAMRLYNAAT